VKLTVLLSPLKVSIAKVADVGRFPMKANLFSSYIIYLLGFGWPSNIKWVRLSRNIP
jgi:hypothetical protein